MYLYFPDTPRIINKEALTVAMENQEVLRILSVCL